MVNFLFFFFFLNHHFENKIVYSFGIIFCEIRFGSKHLNPEKNKGDKFLKVILSCCETNPAKRPFTSQIENLF